jgi:hypothetical protein
MAFNQYTQCVDIKYFDRTSPYVQATLLGLYVTLTPAGFAAFLVIAGAAKPRCLWLLLEIYAMAWIVGFCYWFLYRRLICISSPDHPADSAGDHLAIGLLINIEGPKSGNFFDNLDNDYSIGILPCPLPLGATRAQVVQHSPFGYLIDGDAWAMSNNLPFAGEQALCPGHPQSDKSEVLHCEMEGREIYDLFLAGQAGLFVAMAALVACLIDTPIGMLIAIILFFVSLIAPVIGWIVGQFDRGAPSDVNPNVGTLTQCTDVLTIKGHWVYDSFHTGAFELHPVTFCCKSNCDNGNVILLRDRWEGAINDATSPATLESQKQPQNQWQVHPLIDGCQPQIIV